MTSSWQAAKDFIDKGHKAGKPFFVWFNSTRMHIWTHLKPEWQGKTGLGVYADGMVEHDDKVGQLFKKLDDLGIAKNTIVAVHHRQRRGRIQLARWRHHAVPRREEHQLGGRLPRPRHDRAGPGIIKPGTVINDIVSHEDWLPTFWPLRRAGHQGEAAQGLTGRRQDLQGAPGRLQPERSTWPATAPDPRKEFFYWTDDGDLVAIRYNRWKMSIHGAARRGLSTSGRIPWWYCGFRSSKICTAIPSSARSGKPAITTTGALIASSWFCRR